MKKLLIGLTLLGATLSAFAQNPTLMSNCVLKQDPQTRIVEVSYEMTGDTPVYVTLDIKTNGVPIADLVAVTGDITTLQNPVVIEPGNVAQKKIIWNAKQDWPGNLTTEAVATVTGWFTNDPPSHLILLAKPEYIVVDLSVGSSAGSYPVRASSTPPDISDPICKTTELWLRRIPAGTFEMGSPVGETGRTDSRETQHQVTLTKDFYIGVFQVTQKQYELVMGTNPSAQTNTGDLRPVGEVSYDMIRGDNLGALWPAYNKVDGNSFMGVLRARTPLLFDLPTDAQWEYACRAGTTTALNSGENLANSNPCPNLNQLARYWPNGGNLGTAVVGSYLPNAWGLYDMHGNVNEWCLDWFVANLLSNPISDPTGPGSGDMRVLRGGGYGHSRLDCRSASRHDASPDTDSSDCGFRIAIQP